MRVVRSGLAFVAMLGALVTLVALPAGASVLVQNGSFEEPLFSGNAGFDGEIYYGLPTGWTSSPNAVSADILHRPNPSGLYLYAQPTAGAALYGMESGNTYRDGIQQDIGTLQNGKLYTFNATLFSNQEPSGAKLPCGYQISMYNVTDGRQLAAITEADYNPYNPLAGRQTTAASFTYVATAADNGDALRLILEPKDGTGTTATTAFRTGIDAVSVIEANALAHRWSFNDGTANDSVGTANGMLNGGATVSGGALHLDGVNDYVRTAAIDSTIKAKTLVAWVSLDNLMQKAGGVLTIENPHASDPGLETFDSITYAERADKQWMSGSNGWERSGANDNGGAAETTTNEIMMAISYAANGQITIYRDGQLYASYMASGPMSYTGGVADVVLGLRHHLAGGTAGATAEGTDPFLAGAIDEARIYAYAMNATEIGQLFAMGPNTVPEPSALALAVTGMIGLLAYAWRKRK